jgi:ATP-binding cassette subfamily A (ABC1) protein 3
MRMVFMLAFLSLMIKALRGFVEEKETRIKEGMKMMGLTEAALLTSWTIVYFIQTLLSATLCLLVIKGGFDRSSSSPLFLYFWLYGLCVFTFAYMLSALFSKVQTASNLTIHFLSCLLFVTVKVINVIGTFGALIYFAMFFISFAMSDSTSKGSKIAISLFFPSAQSLGALVFLAAEVDGGLNNDNMGQLYDNYSISICLNMVCILMNHLTHSNVTIVHLV